jgi:hypothetical protein
MWSALRRLVAFALVVAAAVAVIRWRRDEHLPGERLAAPEWPPFDQPAPRWTSPVGGQCPVGYPVKVASSGIYHVPGGRFYERTTPQRCYASTDDAEADGYRAAKA